MKEMNYCVWWEKSAGLGAAFFIHRLCQSCGLCKAGGHWDDPRHQGKSTSCSRWAPWTTSVCDLSWPLGRVSVLIFMYIVSWRLGTKTGGWWTYWPCSAYEEAQGLRTAVCFCLSVAVLRIRMTFIGLHVWIRGPHLVEVFGKELEVWPHWRYVTGCRL